MTIRITLLVLVTGLFAMIWTNDQPAREASSPLTKSHRTGIVSMAQADDSEAERLGASLQDDPSQPAQIAATAAAFSDSEMPLPSGIVPGEYRAVSNTGAVRHLMLTLEELPADSEFVTQDLYQSSGETQRWFFIRVQSNPNEIVPVIAERGSHLVVSEEERRKRQASQIIVRAGQQVAGGVLEALRSMRLPARMSSEEPEKPRL